MRSRLLLTVLALATCAHTAAAEDVTSAHVTVNVTVATRTSLKVSARLLQFDVAEPGGIGTAAIDFAAGARLPAGSDVVLTIEPLRGIDGPGGAADVESDLSFTGEGGGMLAGGSIDTGRGTVVGRWQGSGLREGRLVFTLRASAAGVYSLPLRVVLSTP